MNKVTDIFRDAHPPSLIIKRLETNHSLLRLIAASVAAIVQALRINYSIKLCYVVCCRTNLNAAVKLSNRIENVSDVQLYNVCVYCYN